MNARASLAALEPYAPRLLLSRLARGVDSEAVEAMEGAVLFADITGFTTLAERLASRGPQGAELLTEAINHEFSRVIALVHEHGGDLIKFAGDAIFVLWPAETMPTFLLAMAPRVVSMPTTWPPSRRIPTTSQFCRMSTPKAAAARANPQAIASWRATPPRGWNDAPMTG